MRQDLNFDADALPAQQLLAASLVLRQALRKHPCLQLSVPRTVYEAVPETLFGVLIYDTLAAEFPDLDNRLQLRVRGTEYFSISTPETGAST
jgi:hypothetical protein